MGIQWVTRMILVIDNYDSFTFNLVQYLGQCGAEVDVVRNDQIDLDGVVAKGAAGILLSPGPCTPNESGVCLDVMRAVGGEENPFASVPIFGVCLGHQAIGLVNGGPIRNSKLIKHGKASLVEHDGQGVFEGMPNPFSAIRYHSLVVDEAGLSGEYLVTARSVDDGEIMGLRHREKMIEGVQFHPESIMTEEGMVIVRNFVEKVRSVRAMI